MSQSAQLPFADRAVKAATRLLSRVSFWFGINIVLLVSLLYYHFTPSIPKMPWWPDVFAVASNVLTGGVVSFLFYVLVVAVPERRKKRIIKTNITKVYRTIKEDILWEVVSASIKGGRDDLALDPDTIANLMTISGFKAAFDGGREANEGFYAFANQMNSPTFEFQAIVLDLGILSKQIDFLLHNYSFDDQELFNFFKRLETFLVRLEHSSAGYDESKELCGFIREIFAGFNFFEGKRDHDIIERMIASI